MAINESELFPGRVPIILDRCNLEKRYVSLRGARVVAPEDQTLRDIIKAVKDKACIPEEEEVVIMAGE